MCHSLLCALLLLVVLAPGAAAQPGDAAGHAEEITFSNGDVSLAATLSFPPGAGPFPAVVLVHGSGSSDRSNAWTAAYAGALVERGVAVLHPDKRGSGASGGTWQDATFTDLAQDAVAGLDVLRARPEVDSTRVGFIGFSQGGHVVPVAATLTSAAAFVINVSGSVVSMMEQIGDEIRMMGEREGLSPDELAAVDTLHALATRYILKEEGWDAYAAALADAREGRLGTTEVVMGFPTEPDSPVWRFLRLIGDFDPLPYWREVSIPALFLYGGRDENVDVYKSADVIEAQLTPTGLAYALLLFRNNGHALFREDAMDLIARWIRDSGAG